MGKGKKKIIQIFEAAQQNKASHLKVFLNDDPTITTLRNNQGFEPLHMAADAGALESVDLLINWGADPNAIDNAGYTPLHMSVRKGFFEISRKLIDGGAEPWRETEDQNTALHLAVQFTAKNATDGKKLLQLLLEYKKYDVYTWERLVETKNIMNMNPMELALDLSLPKVIINFIAAIKPPEEEHIVNILLHGWNDNLADWKIIESNFEQELNQLSFLFAYNSLVNRVSIPSLSSELREFINEKREYYCSQKSKVSFGKKCNISLVKVNLICYSTGALIIRTFLNKWYVSEFKDVIERVVMVAPANFGSPFAKFGKSSVGRMYVGQKKVGSLFECGEELLTSLEPGSEFLWNLANEDIFCPIEQQHFLPNKIMATVIQGSQHYEKNLQSKVTRGDMKGTDGTVTISGASMRCIKYFINLSGGYGKETAVVQRSTGQVAIKLHPSHTHRSITTSLVEESDVFSLVKRALEATREQFKEMQKSFEAQNTTVYSKTHTPGNLLVFKYEGSIKPVILPVVVYHKKEIIPEIGQAVDTAHMQVESRGNIVGDIRNQFSYTEYHSRSRNMFYKIVDLAMVSNIMVSMASELPGCAISLAICLKGQTQFARIIASTSWIEKNGDCFVTSKLSSTHLFSISPSQGELDGTLAASQNTTGILLSQLEEDEEIDYSLRQLHTTGIMQLCRSLYDKESLEFFVDLVCKKKADQLSGETRASVIRSLVPFFGACPFSKEGAAYLIATTSYQQLSSLKMALDTPEITLVGEDFPSAVRCRSLYHLVFELFNEVPVKFLKDVNDSKVLSFTSIKNNQKMIHLSNYVSEHIFQTSKRSNIVNVKKGRKILCSYGSLMNEKNNDSFIKNVPFPGVHEFLSKMCENVNASIILLKSDEGPSNLPFSLPIIDVCYGNNLSSAVDNYQRLFPEYEYLILFEDTPIFNNVSRSLHGATVFYHTLNPTGKNMFDCYVSLGGECMDRDLLEVSEVTSIVKKSVEDLQLRVIRNECTHPNNQWNKLFINIEKVIQKVKTVENSQSHAYHLSVLKDMRDTCKCQEASLWLSKSGADMIIKLRDWAKTNSPKSTSKTSNSDILIKLLSQEPSLRNLLIEDVSIDNPLAKSKVAVPAVPPRRNTQTRPRSNQSNIPPRGKLLRRGSLTSPMRTNVNIVPTQYPRGGVPAVRSNSTENHNNIPVRGSKSAPGSRVHPAVRGIRGGGNQRNRNATPPRSAPPPIPQNRVPVSRTTF